MSSKPKPAVRFRLLQAGEEQLILAMFRESFGGSMTPQEYDWKYRQVPNCPTVEYVAEVQTAQGWELAGFYGLQGAEFGHPTGKSYLFFQEVDLMVHPRFRGMGVFTGLSLSTHEYSTSLGGRVNFGFPNERSGPIGFTKLQWLNIGNMTIWCGYLRWQSTRLRWLNPLLGWRGWKPGQQLLERAQLRSDPQLTAAIVEVPATEVHGLLSLLPQEDGRQFRALRTPQWFAWRYLLRPGYSYRFLALPDGRQRLRGLAVFRTQEHHGVREVVVLDLLATTEEARRALLTGLLATALREEVDTVRCWSKPHTALGQELRQLGFAPKPGPRHAAYVFIPDVDASLVANPEHWATTQGDSDTA